MVDLSAAEKDLIQRIAQKPELRPFFFKKARGVKWFGPLSDNGFFNPEENPRPVPARQEGYFSVPFWPATDYLVAIADELQDPANEAIAAAVLGIIRRTTEHAKEHKYWNFRTWWQFAKVIRKVPAGLIRDEDLALITYWLADPYEKGLLSEQLGVWVDELLKTGGQRAHAIALDLIKRMFEVSVIVAKEGEREMRRIAISTPIWHANKILERLGTLAGRILGEPLLNVLQANLRTVTRELKNDKWSTLWRRAIEDHEQNHNDHDAEDIVVKVYRDALRGHAEQDPARAKEWVVTLLRGDHQIEKRLAMDAITHAYDGLAELAKEATRAEYFDSELHHEVWRLLNERYARFSADGKADVLHAISMLEATNEDGAVHAKATAFKQARYLAAVKDSGVREAELYRRAAADAGQEPDHPAFTTYTSGGWVKHESPITKNELVALAPDELVERLNAYEDAGRWGQPSLEGLTKAVKEIVKSDPVRYKGYLKSFLNADLPFVYEVLAAYEDLWNQNAVFPWDEIWAELLVFCRSLVEQEEFWAPESEEKQRNFVANKDWIVGLIGRLVEIGTKSDDHAFAPALLPQAQELLIDVLGKQPGEPFAPDTDAVSLAINSPRGRCLEGLINLSLRLCRLSDKEKAGHVDVWGRLQPIYERELALVEAGQYEFGTLVTNYLPNFLYMSSGWTYEKLDEVFSKTNEQQWLCAMQGYAHVRNVHERVYKHLRDGGHLIRALDDGRLKDRVHEKIIQNIVVAYLQGMEALEVERSLIRMLLSRRSPEELGHLIWFVWTLRKQDDPEQLEPILRLWEELIAVLNPLKREDTVLASKLSQWIDFIDKIDDRTRRLLMSVVQFAEEDYNAYHVLEGIARLSNNQPMEAAEIWGALLARATPSWPSEAIETALKNIVAVGPDGKRRAKQLVENYIRAGNEEVPKMLTRLLQSG